MLNAIFRPIVTWPGEETPPGKRKNSRFRAGYQKTLDDLAKELGRINAVDVIVQLDLGQDQIRADGWPRSSARPNSPRVILTFTKDRKTISMPCDCFRHYEQNLRAIGLTLHALRMINQYGVTQHDQQYAGFALLPRPDTSDSRHEALRFIAVHAGIRTEDVAMHIDGAYRLAAKRLHPDEAGGTHEDFVLLQKHYQYLKNPRQ